MLPLPLPAKGNRLVILAAVLCLTVPGAVLLGVWSRRSEDREVRDAALPRCIERLGDEADCAKRIDAFHDECARITRHRPDRGGGKSSADPDRYLECVVLSPDAWSEQRGQERRRQARERERDLSGH
jgi:hypothetical protein